MSIKKFIAEKVIFVAEKAAEVACGSASIAGLYQTEEPAELEVTLAAIKSEKK